MNRTSHLLLLLVLAACGASGATHADKTPARASDTQTSLAVESTPACPACSAEPTRFLRQSRSTFVVAHRRNRSSRRPCAPATYRPR